MSDVEMYVQPDNSSINKVRPAYCRQCGQALVEDRFFVGYHADTGKRLHGLNVRCPRSIGWLSHFWGNHDVWVRVEDRHGRVAWYDRADL